MLGEEGEGGPSSFCSAGRASEYQKGLVQGSEGKGGDGRTVSSTTGFFLPSDMLI